MSIPALLEYVGKPCAFKVAIPTCGRPDQVCTHSLAFLCSQGLDLGIVTLFVRAEERQVYKQAIAKHSMAGPTFITVPRLTAEGPPPELKAAIKKAYSHYADGTHLIVLNDTLRDIRWQHNLESNIWPRHLCPSSL